MENALLIQIIEEWIFDTQIGQLFGIKDQAPELVFGEGYIEEMDGTLLLFRIQRSKRLKYSIGVFGILVFYVLVTRVFWGASPGPQTAQNAVYEGISSYGHDLSNAEVNSLISQGNVVLKRELEKFRLVTPYLNNEVSEQNYQFNGDVMIRNDRYVRLTQEKKHQTSSFFSNHKMQEKSFIMEFKFSLNGKGDVSALHADGFGLFLTSDKLPEGELFGVHEYYNGFAVYVDTYRNGRTGVFPYVLAARNDGTQKYDKDHDGKANEMSGCIARSLWNPKNGHTNARLVYVEDGYVSLDFDYKNDGNWQNCFSLQDVKLPELVHVGFSAQTGDLHENVDILEVHVYSLYDHQGAAISDFQRIIQLMDDPNSPDKFTEVTEEYRVNDNTKRRRKVSQKKDERQTRRTLRRLQNAEKRLKREAEQRRQERRKRRAEFFTSIKKYIYFFFFIVVVYLGTVVYRVHKRNTMRRLRNHGLLD